MEQRSRSPENQKEKKNTCWLQSMAFAAGGRWALALGLLAAA